MKAEDFIVEILSILPEHVVHGKKRLQKLCVLAKYAGADLDAEFEIKHWGPFSAQVAQAAADLVFVGWVKEKSVSVGDLGIFQTDYQLDMDGQSDDSQRGGGNLPESVKQALLKLDAFRTVELEVASTVAYFMRDGGLDKSEAVKKTKAMKPNKSVPAVMSKLDDILGILNHNV